MLIYGEAKFIGVLVSGIYCLKASKICQNPSDLNISARKPFVFGFILEHIPNFGYKSTIHYYLEEFVCIVL
jgi:hypothetical protein